MFRWLGSALLVVGLVVSCDLAPYPRPSSTGEIVPNGGGGNDPGGGLEPIGGTSGEVFPCGNETDAGAFVSQTQFAAAGHEQLDAAYVDGDGAAWISLGYDQSFEVEGMTLAAPSDRDVVILRVSNGTTTDLHRIHGTGDQHVIATTYDGTLHVVGRVTDAASGGAAQLIVNDVVYDGFVDGDAFYLHVVGTAHDVYRLAGTSIVPKALTIDLLGHAWVVGDFSGTLTLSGTPNAGGLLGTIATVTGTAPNLNSFAARLALGNEKLTAIGPPEGEGTVDDETQIAGAVPFSNDGEVIVFGDFRGRVQLRTSLYESEGQSDLWLARVEPDGTVSDRQHYGGVGDVRASAFILTPGGRAITAGVYSGDVGFLDPPDGTSGMFVSQIKLNDLKRGRTSTFSAPTGELRPTSLAPYPWGNGVIITGDFTGESFPLAGDIATNTDATPDAFILALGGDLEERYAWHLAATGTASLRGVATAPCHPAAVLGVFESGTVEARRMNAGGDPLLFSDAALSDAFLLRLSY